MGMTAPEKAKPELASLKARFRLVSYLLLWSSAHHDDEAGLNLRLGSHFLLSPFLGYLGYMRRLTRLHS